MIGRFAGAAATTATPFVLEEKRAQVDAARDQRLNGYARELQKTNLAADDAREGRTIERENARYAADAEADRVALEATGMRYAAQDREAARRHELLLKRLEQGATGNFKTESVLDDMQRVIGYTVTNTKDGGKPQFFPLQDVIGALEVAEETTKKDDGPGVLSKAFGALWSAAKKGAGAVSDAVTAPAGPGPGPNSGLSARPGNPLKLPELPTLPRGRDISQTRGSANAAPAPQRLPPDVPAPDAKTNKGRTITDQTTGIKYVSDGESWLRR